VTLLAMGLAGLLAISIPALTNWIDQGPFLTYTMERKLEGLRKSIAVVQQVSKQVEQATSGQSETTLSAKPPEKVVVRDKTLLGEVASTTPGLVLQVGYAAVLAFMLLAHRNTSRRQILRILPASRRVCAWPACCATSRTRRPALSRSADALEPSRRSGRPRLACSLRTRSRERTGRTRSLMVAQAGGPGAHASGSWRDAQDLPARRVAVASSMKASTAA